jgi:GNAT superfamily N-acetyltransferase
VASGCGTLLIRSALPTDAAAASALLAASYGGLLPPYYPYATLALALPAMTRANPELLACGSWYVAESRSALVACGGWTFAPPGRRWAGRLDEAHLRHFATHPDWVRQGIGGALLARSLAVARACGVRRMRADASLAAVRFYAAHGFQPLRRITLTVESQPFAVVRMMRPL